MLQVLRISGLFMCVFIFYNFSACLPFRQVYSEDVEEIKVIIGKCFILKLSSNSSTGYQWEDDPSTDPEFLLIEQAQYFADKPIVPGSGGYEIWKFRAIKKGKTYVYMKYAQPWDSNSTVKQFKIEVEIK